MDYTSKSRTELIAICKEMKIRGYSNKKKDELIKAIALGPDSVPIQMTSTAMLTEILTTHTMKEAATKLNLAVGTVARWIELDNIPPQYTFDLMRILSKPVQYQDYKSSAKDQFFTPDDVVKRCWTIFNEVTKVNIAEYTFIEPSAGDGAFIKVLPQGTIAMDVEPRNAKIVAQDYLTWAPPTVDASNKKYIVFGNPPFGLRGHVALNFINHSHKFADYVCFILPQLFESDGKGSPRKRITGYNLVYSEKVSAPFYTPENTNVDVNGVFQIWSKHTSDPKYTISVAAQDEVKIYSLSDGGTVATTRNKKMLDKCDIYLPSTCFGKDTMRVYNSFEELPGRKGYGIVFLKNKEANMEKSRGIDWSTVAFLSTNSAYNLRTSLIMDAFTG